MKETLVKLNYEYNHTSDTYSDGDVEETLLQFVKENEQYDAIAAATDSFPIFYHLSKERECIVEPMMISKNDTVLEIGSGCGAITGALAKRAAVVNCVELSERRSMINAYKNHSCDNVEIYVGSYQDVHLDRQYDVVTLIGVFEYAMHYFHSDNPYVDFLLDVLGKVKEGGQLYIAIENRLGAKYLSGCIEDHAGYAYEGINGYPKYKNAKTFSYNEWINLLEKCGIKKYRFMYPHPDYKFPRVIYSDDFLPSVGDFVEPSSNYYKKRGKSLDEIQFLNSLDMKNEFKLFANSYLICITK
ncbi:class I SAM-dependent methyltransferase [Anaerovibrio lipolyticus]|uniref:class I SAM-dependent methyltransferase n=1 Tax=Anaerovibrio lipolyticus TaxID=82374 RepID=UPI0004859700|nr:methyltransferase domain-containing protein [Anaerovibrio lipolyticus]